MTCKQMGGPCDYPITGKTAEEMMNNGNTHVNEMVEQGDEPHKMVLNQMEEIGKDPVATQSWITKFTTDFNTLPETVEAE